MMDKYEKLINYLKGLESVIIAFSGGVDSTFLLKACKDALKDKVLGVTLVSPYVPTWEIEEAKELKKELEVPVEFVKVDIPKEIIDNPENRCYLCKKAIFSKIRSIAKERNIKYILDGTNADDVKDYRPGMIALKELEIISPLLECGITKEEIRNYSKVLGLNTWKKPAYACLLSRIPYNQKIKEEDLRKIEKSEVYLMNLGLKGIRVRCHGDLARIEVRKKDREKLFDISLLDTISNKLKEFGFKYVTLELSGYEMGSLNKQIKIKKNLGGKNE